MPDRTDYLDARTEEERRRDAALPPPVITTSSSELKYLEVQAMPGQSDYAIPPGDTLIEEMRFLGMSALGLSEVSGLSFETIAEVMLGTEAITEPIAEGLARAMEIPAQLWLNLQAQYGRIGGDSMPEKTVEIIEQQAKAHGLEEELPELLVRFRKGLEVYGEQNHLSDDFDTRRELQEELYDAFNLTCIALRRGDLPDIFWLLKDISRAIVCLEEEPWKGKRDAT